MCMCTWNVCACIHKEDVHVYIKMCTRERCARMQKEYVHLHMKHICLCTWGIHGSVHEETVHVSTQKMYVCIWWICLCTSCADLEVKGRCWTSFSVTLEFIFFHKRPSAEPNLRLKSSKPWLSYLHVLNPWCYRSVCCYWLLYLFIVFVGTEDLTWDL